MKNGTPTSVYADMRPIAVSERILRANCWRLRTVSETMSKSVASDPPTCRWIVTAVIAKPKFSEPMPVGHVAERVVERPAEARLGEHALQLVARRRLRLVEHRLEPVLERMARLQRRGDRRQHVRQLLLERLDPAAHPEGDEPVREQRRRCRARRA